MADGPRDVYLSPEDDLTTVRERFQQIPFRHIALVVPPQTQLRSHMSWKLIHGYAREAGKDVLVVSSDRAIRAVVKAAGFQVAESLEATKPGKGRYGSRAGRTDTRARGSAASRLRTPPTRGPEPPTGAGRSTMPSPRPPAAFPAQPPDYAKKDFQVDDVGEGDAVSSRPPVYGAPSPAYGPEYNFSPGVMQPGSPPIEDEDDEVLPSGAFHPGAYDQARSLRQAAQEGVFAPEQSAANVEPERSVDTSLAHAADDETLTMPEQRASVFPSSERRGSSDIGNLPTDVFMNGEIEDLGEKDDFPSASSPPYAAWSGETAEEDATEQPLPPPRVRGVPSRASQSGSIRPPAIPDRPTEDLPGSAQSRSSAKIPTVGASRAPEPHILPLPGQAAQRTPSRPIGASDRTRTPSKVPARRQKVGAQRPARSGNSALPVIVGILVFLVILGLLAYFIPTATVAVTLPAQAYHEQMAYTASPGSPINIVTHTMPAQTLSFPITVQGTGQATGNKPVGTVAATGTVTFTNKTSSSVEIPTGTIVTTSNGVAFATTADALVLGNSSNVEPVQASQPGTDGNVPANAITVIPQSTITQLQQANPNVTISLTVTNAAPTTGGGARNETTITDNDVKSEVTKLSPQVNDEVKAYINKHTASDDVTGKPVLAQTPVASPAVGSVVNNGTFTLILHVQASVLIVNAADLQNVASQQINAVLKQAKRNEEVAPQHPVQITDVKTKDLTLHGNKALSLTFNALGQIVPQVSVDQIRGIVSGKSPGSARTALLNKRNGIAAIQDATITVNPAFIGLVPFWQQHITVDFKTGAPVTKPAPKATPTPHAKK